MAKVRKAIIPAAGLGTRFLPATKALPKEMLPIVDKPTIQFIIEECIASGIEEILVITGRNKKSLEDHFDRNVELEHDLEKKGKTELLSVVQDITTMIDIHYIRQKDPKGLGHAVSVAKSFVGNEPFAVLLGDDVVYNDEKPCLKQLIDAYNKCGGTVLGVQEVAPSETKKYGVVAGIQLTDNLTKVETMVEKPAEGTAPSRNAVLGRYVISPRIFDILAKTEPGVGGEIQLTDALCTLATKEDVFAYNFEGRRYDIGNQLGFLEATVEYALRREDTREEFLKYLEAIVEKAKVTK